MSTAVVPEGWYDDPDDPDRVRWWDGQAWTNDIQPLATATFSPPAGASPAQKGRGRRAKHPKEADSQNAVVQAELRKAFDWLDHEFKAWTQATASERKAVEATHSRYLKQVKAAKKQVKAASKPMKLTGGAFLPVTVHETHLTIKRQRFELVGGIRANVDAAGNISRTRRYTATRTALLGPATLFVPKATKHDDRELFLVIEAPEWSEVVKLDPNRQREARELAQAINSASTQADQHLAAFNSRVQDARADLQDALGATNDIEDAERVLRERDAEDRRQVHAARVALEHALVGVDSSANSHTKRAHKLLGETGAALDADLAVPPRPDLLVTDKLDPDIEDTDEEADRIIVYQGEEFGSDTEGPSDEPVPPGATPADPFDAIRRLGELRDAGLISEAQFETKRTELLGRL